MPRKGFRSLAERTKERRVASWPLGDRQCGHGRAPFTTLLLAIASKCYFDLTRKFAAYESPGSLGGVSERGREQEFRASEAIQPPTSHLPLEAAKASFLHPPGGSRKTRGRHAQIDRSFAADLDSSCQELSAECESVGVGLPRS